MVQKITSSWKNFELLHKADGYLYVAASRKGDKTEMASERPVYANDSGLTVGGVVSPEAHFKDRDDVKYISLNVPLDLDLLRERYERDFRPYLLIPELTDLTMKLWIEMIEEERARL
jgi:hypothetical protein